MAYRMNNAVTRELFDDVLIKGGSKPHYMSEVTKMIRSVKNYASDTGTTAYTPFGKITRTLVYASALAVAGCGGGSDSNPPPPPTNRSPVISSYGANPNSGTAPLNTAFNWGISDPDGDTMTCQIDADSNGTPEYTLNNCAPNGSQAHTYTAAGNYTSRLTVTDGKGGSATTTTAVGVNAPAMATVSGAVTDELTDSCTAAVQNIPVTLIYISDNNRQFQTNTSPTCTYSIQVPLISGQNNDQFELRIRGTNLYDYTEPLRTTSAATINLELFEKFTDPLNATSTDPRKDLRQFILYMTATDGSVIEVPSGRPYTILRRWRDQDIPVDVFAENPPTTPVNFSAITDAFISSSNSRFNAYRRVTANPAVGIRIVYSDAFGPAGNAIIEQFATDSSGNPLHPVKYRIEIKTNLGSNTDFYRIVMEHEGNHTWFSSRHSPFINHQMTDSGIANGLTPFEERALKVVRNLTLGKDMARYN